MRTPRKKVTVVMLLDADEAETLNVVVANFKTKVDRPRMSRSTILKFLAGINYWAPFELAVNDARNKLRASYCRDKHESPQPISEFQRIYNRLSPAQQEFANYLIRELAELEKRLREHVTDGNQLDGYSA